jgi:hypothetical protein
MKRMAPVCASAPAAMNGARTAAVQNHAKHANDRAFMRLDSAGFPVPLQGAEKE